MRSLTRAQTKTATNEVARTRCLRGLAGALMGIAVGASVGAASASDDPAPSARSTVETRAVAALAPFKKELMATLKAGLAEDPVGAIDSCRIEAPRIASRASQGDVSVGRTSHKLRNPSNAPEPWMETVLQHYLANPADRAPRVVALDAGRSGYAEPIGVKPPCLTCHGKAIPQPIQEQLALRYPEDRATGFDVGDLRGIFWVELPSEP